MMDTELDQEFFAELSAFIASARKEGFSFKPSQIVKDKDYCNDVIATLVEKGSEALATSAIKVINRCGNLGLEHEITKRAHAKIHDTGVPEMIKAS
jgi:hypothetical protein